MKIPELISYLKLIEQHTPGIDVVLSVDDEGNGLYIPYYSGATWALVNKDNPRDTFGHIGLIDLLEEFNEFETDDMSELIKEYLRVKDTEEFKEFLEDNGYEEWELMAQI